MDRAQWFESTHLRTIHSLTFVFSVVGILIGHIVGCRFHKGAGIFGGIVLIGIGLKILVEHLLS